METPGSDEQTSLFFQGGFMFNYSFSQRLLAVVALASAAAMYPEIAQAQFDTLERFGGLQASGNIEFQDYDFSKSKVVSDGVGFHNAGFDTLDYALDIEGLTLTAPWLTASGTGRATQRSVYDGTTLRVEATGTVSMTGEAAIGALFANAGATSNFQATFLIFQPTAMDLFMTSAFNTANGIYSFSLARDDGTVVWNQVSVKSPQGDDLFTFDQPLNLTPGVYTLNSSLSALGALEPTSTNSISNASSLFSITALVPEPGQWLLMMPGIAMLAWWRRARRPI